MKSFFKKLAFVMALAMVVTLAAPAAQASAATALAIALQSATAKEEAVTEYQLEVGASENFKYYYAPKNYKDLNPTWVSSNPDVAIVDKEGIVTGLKDGVATIAIKLDNGQVGTVKVTVGKGEVPAELVKAEQISDTQVKLTFFDKATDISNLAFFYLVGETKIYYPCKVDSYKDGVATITSYISFADGLTYGFEVAGLEAKFDAVIGDVAYIVPSWKSEGENNTAYATKETTVSYKLLNAKGIDITNAATGTVEFSFVAESETGAYWFSNQEKGEIHFEEEGASAQVVLKYNTGKFDEVTYEPIIGATQKCVITSVKVPGFELNKTALPVANLEKNGANTDWAKASNVIALDDDDAASFRLVAKFKSNKGDVTTKDTTYGEFTFQSADPSKLFVYSDGSIMTNAVGETMVVVYFTPAGTNNKTAVGVVKVDVRAKRAVSTFTPNTNSVTVSTKDPYNEAEITFTLKDQLQENISSAITVEPKSSKAPKYDANSDCSLPVVRVEGNKVVITGDEANVPKNAKSYTYTFTAKAGSKTATFSVVVRRPDSTISGYKVEFGGASDVKTTANANLYATATLYAMSNGVKSDILVMGNRPDKAADAISGQYYYTVSKGATKLSIPGTTTALNIQLTNINSTTIASGTTIDVVDKNMQGKGGAGSYTVVVYQAVGEAGKAASGFRQIATNTLTVKDSQDTMAAKATKENKVRNVVEAATVVEAVKNGFKFKYGNTTYEVKNDGTDTYASNNVILVPSANYMLDTNGNLASGSVCFIKSVDFYIPVGGGAHVKYTVTVNDYVEIK